ncbi:glutaredoxin [Thermanaerothrix daxensis]|uniref:Glutaredoxin n=1 Tax=Thermanaerothrix daxensis TaxID=869279 RepID=A0A0P6YKV3_9CHLR|nr:thioredoxin family protein [Thermanaerothrix daxensis]KPL83175.1 glutaredoxin [Thermanaerothrix daxensis]
MALLNAQVREQVRSMLSEMEHPVKLLMFTQGEGGAIECAFCAETRQLAEELTSLSDKLTLEVHDFIRDKALAENLKVDKIPALIIQSAGEHPKDYGVRFFGIPSGYEFGTLIEDILMVSRRKPDLSLVTLQQLARLDRPVHLQVFVTPTCPYCPRAVLLAHKLALASDWITADMVEVSEFPHLANRYHVYGVPRTVINEVIHIEGAVPENVLMAKLMLVMDDQVMEELKRSWSRAGS